MTSVKASQAAESFFMLLKYCKTFDSPIIGRCVYKPEDG